MPRVSAIVPCYNTAKYLPAALDSVIAQTYGDWEIVLVDDGSTDNTPAIAAEYKKRLGDRLQYVRQENRGLSAARNTAIRSARGEFLAILDADDIWLPERLARGVALMDADAEVALLHSGVLFMDAAGQPLFHPRQDRRRLSGRIARQIYTREIHLPCPTVLIRASVLRSVGLFDEGMRATEDRDLWFRIASRHKVGYVDDVLAGYRVSAGSMSSDLDRMRSAQRAFARKHYRAGSVSWSEQRRAMAGIHHEMADAQRARGHGWRALGWRLRAAVDDPFSPSCLGGILQEVRKLPVLNRRVRVNDTGPSARPRAL
ncbi:MAG: glycosyltransferase family 2 protein [Terriglobales bacterium]